MNADPLFQVADQTVLVAGASRGIGFAIAQGFASRGAQVIMTGRVAETLEQAALEVSRTSALPVEYQVCDVLDPEAVQQTVASIVARHGSIDTLVQVAGINRRKPAMSITEADFDAILDTNLKGAFLMAQQVGRVMIERGSGCQIHVTSLNVDRPLTQVAPYAMSKAGLQQMVRALASEWGAHGVRVNGLAPGFILTDLTQKLWSDPTMAEWGKANTPQRRLGLPEDLVGAAIFLASPAAAFINGVSLVVDGGFSAGWSWPIPDNNQ